LSFPHWYPVTHPPPLPPGQVHVWAWALDATHRTAPGVLSALGRSALRHLLGAYLTCAPDDLHFVTSTYGKPSLDPLAHRTRIDFSVAHTDGMILLAFSLDGALGIDCERMAPLPDQDDVAALILTPSEHARYTLTPPGDRQSLFFRWWTCKEAVVKQVGLTLDDMSRASVALPESAAQTPIRFALDNRVGWLLECPPIPGVAAAVTLPYTVSADGVHFYRYADATSLKFQ